MVMFNLVSCENNVPMLSEQYVLCGNNSLKVAIR